MTDPLIVASIFTLAIAPITGSFLGTVVLRVPEGQSVVQPRSACDSCGHTLGAIDLLPVINWIASRGRCRYCGTSVPAFYPLIEVAAIVVVIWCWIMVPDWARVAGIVLGWALMALVIMDLRGTLMPDRLTLTLLPLGLFAAWLNASAVLIDHLIGSVVGFAIGYAFVTGAKRLGRRPAPAMGEAKLLAAAGAWVAWQGLPMVVAAALLAACLIGLWGRLTTHRPYADGRLAAGASIAIGVWLVWLYGPLMYR